MREEYSPDTRAQLVQNALVNGSLAQLRTEVQHFAPDELVETLERLDRRNRALTFRVLEKERALAVFELLDSSLQADLIRALREDEVAAVFADLEPDDRVSLLDELPAALAHRLLHGLPAHDREKTGIVLGYPAGSIGRRMSPEFVSLPPQITVEQALDRVRARVHYAETVYTLPVVGKSRELAGVVSLRELIGADLDTPVRELMSPATAAHAAEKAEDVARRCADRRFLSVPIVDAEERLVGILTVDDALQILEEADSEDYARLSGSEPLRRPYLSTGILSVVRSRVLWLLVLAVGATLTVQVLEAFESTLEQVVALALFIPLLIGIGGNTGNQAATTVTRALALGDVRKRDILRVFGRELRVGALLGVLLGGLGFLIAGWFYGAELGWVIAATLLAICTLAATVGGIMPLIGQAIRADPAVFSNPFITTFIDATGLIVYFLIARAVLGL